MGKNTVSVQRQPQLLISQECFQIHGICFGKETQRKKKGICVCTLSFPPQHTEQWRGQCKKAHSAWH